jgi:ribosomal protein L29
LEAERNSSHGIAGNRLGCIDRVLGRRPGVQGSTGIEQVAFRVQVEEHLAKIQEQLAKLNQDVAELQAQQAAKRVENPGRTGRGR